jgi:hypothetical protein
MLCQAGAADYISCARKAMRAKQYGRANDCLKKALEGDPQDLDAIAIQADLKQKAQDEWAECYGRKQVEPEGAAKHCQLVMEMVPKNDELYRKAERTLTALGAM